MLTMLAAWLLACSAAAQSPAPILRLEGDRGPLGAFVTRTTAVLYAAAAAPEPLAPAKGAGVLLGLLRLGDHAAARRLLDRMVVGIDAAAGAYDRGAPWLVVGHYWYLRATHDAATIRAHWPQLVVAVGPVPADPTVLRGSFVEAAMHVHMLLCFGGLLDQLDRLEHPGRWQHGGPLPRPGAAWTTAAITLQLALEAMAWQPLGDHFAASVPAPAGELHADVSVLLPAAAGMLVATGDRAQQNLRNVLQRTTGDALRTTLSPTPVAAPGASLRLIAASQVGNTDARRRSWTECLVEARGEAVTPAASGWRLDAILFALTGARVATGPGLDEDHVRIRPHLPPDEPSLAVRGLCLDGARIDLTLAMRSGPAAADEAAEPALCDRGAAGPRLRAAVTLQTTTAGNQRTVVLQGPGLQYITRLGTGDTLERSLPTSH